MHNRIIIQTEQRGHLGVVLKQLIPEDANPYFLLVNKSRAHLSQYGDSTAKKYPTKESVLKSITNPVNPKKLRFGIWDGGIFVGMVGLTPLQHGICETGGWTGEEFCRKGYGTATRRALATYALEELKYKRVIAKTHPNNISSQKMLLKAGYKRTKRTKIFYYFVFVK